MGNTTKIAWTDATLSPWIGCAQCSPGCYNCYAKTISDRFYKDVTWGSDANKWRPVGTFFARTMALERKAIRLGRPLFVFPSMCDPFYAQGLWDAEEWIETAVRTPHLIWLLLTKRPELIPDISWPRNVWLGVTAENQEYADKRIPELLKKRCAVRFVSVEPMLGPVDLTSWFHRTVQTLTNFGTMQSKVLTHEIDWVICGGETGRKARMMDPFWAFSLRDQCKAAGVPFWFKQWGSNFGRAYAHNDWLDGHQHHERPDIHHRGTEGTENG